jgi:hypothetical protein
MNSHRQGGPNLVEAIRAKARTVFPALPPQTVCPIVTARGENASSINKSV